MSAPASTTGQTASSALEWAGFSEAWRRGFREIYAIRLSRGQGDPGEEARKQKATWIRWLGLAFGLPILTIVILTCFHTHGDHLGDRIALLLLLGVINGGMFAAAVLAWGFALQRSHTIDDLLRPCTNRDRVVEVIHQGVTHKYQASLPAIFATIPAILSIVQGLPHQWTYLGFVLLTANAVFTMALLGNVSYWLIVPPIMVLRMHSCSEMMFRWNDPARTPGIRTFAEGYAYPALFLAMGPLL